MTPQQKPETTTQGTQRHAATTASSRSMRSSTTYLGSLLLLLCEKEETVSWVVWPESINDSEFSLHQLGERGERKSTTAKGR